VLVFCGVEEGAALRRKLREEGALPLLGRRPP
jgi:hypothetical protein